MQTEATLIKAFLSYAVWEKHAGAITAKDLPEDLQFLYRVLDSYHKTNESMQDLHILDLANLFFAQHKGNEEYYQGVFQTLESYTPAEKPLIGLIQSLKQTKQMRMLSLLAYDIAEGRQPYTAFEEFLSTTAETVDSSEQEEIASDDLEELLEQTYTTGGLHFRLKVLQKILGPIRQGNFGIMFARIETGKTTWLASEVTHMAEQLKAGDGPILWLNNEQVDGEVKLRIMQAALGVTLTQILSNKAKYSKEYKDRFAGRIVLPKHLISMKNEVERLCNKYKPSLIVFDQIDKIKGFEADREDLVLGALYEWARGLAKKYCPIIGVCQADGSADGQKWLTMANMSNSKTSKAAEADWILGIGKTYDNGYENIRYLNVCKNKLLGDENTDPKMRHARVECLIEPEIARFADI